MESIPAGADRCAGIGPLADPEVTGLTNDGPIVAFAGFDAAHAGDLWLGDLRSGAVEMVYQAATGIEIASPQLASGHLLWIEWAREAAVDYSVGGAGGPGVTEWWLKDMDTQSRRIATLAHDHTTGFGGATFADKIVFDGSRLGIEEQIQDAATRIVVQDWPSGKSVQSVTVADRVYDFALTGDGVLYSAGADRYGPYGTDHVHLIDCPREGSCQTVAPDVYDVAASGDVVAWLADPSASQDSDSLPGARLYTTNAKLGPAQAVSSTEASRRSQGIRGIASGSGMVAWWEQDADVGPNTLAVWTPGSVAPFQLATSGDSVDVSLGGGWLAWFEDVGSGDSSTTRVRAVPITAIVKP
jgi:hypothetical protein